MGALAFIGNSCIQVIASTVNSGEVYKMAACLSGAVADPLTSAAERGLTAWVEMIPMGACVCVCARVCVCSDSRQSKACFKPLDYLVLCLVLLRNAANVVRRPPT